MRTPIIAGNWKMNKTVDEAVTLINELKPLVKDAKAEVVVCVPYIAISAAAKALEGSNITLGAQNLYFKDSGAYTGEISPLMLTSLGVKYVIIGHSERRQYFCETDETVNLKVLSALSNGLKPIICVGESLDQRENGITDELVSLQTKLALRGVTSEQLENCVIAYEPIWAIGTGKTATDDEADETIGVIRKAIADVYGDILAQKIRIQYGGSMNPKNASSLMAKSEIDGGLIGGASLKAVDFSQVVNF